MKHTDYLNRKPGAIVALEKRIDSLSQPATAAREFNVKVHGACVLAEAAFRKNPSAETCDAWDSALSRRKSAEVNSIFFDLTNQAGHEQRAMKRASIAAFEPFLLELIKLLNADLDDTRKRIKRSLDDINAETDSETVRPMPELKAKLAHVENLRYRLGHPALCDDSVVEQIFGLFNGGLGRVVAAHAPMPGPEGMFTAANRMKREELARAVPLAITTPPPLAREAQPLQRAPIPLTPAQEAHCQTIERWAADERAANLRKLSEKATV